MDKKKISFHDEMSFNTFNKDGTDRKQVAHSSCLLFFYSPPFFCLPQKQLNSNGAGTDP